MISGAATFTLALAEGMACLGHQILVLAASDTGKAYRSTQTNLEIQRLRSRPNRLRARQQMTLWPYREVQQALKGFQPDIIHLQAPLAMGLAGIAAGQRLGIPVVLTTHQLPGFVGSYLKAAPWLGRRVEGLLWSYARLINRRAAMVAPSITTAKTLARAGISAVTIGYGLDLDLYQPQPEHDGEREQLCRQYGLDPARPVLLHVGRLDADKQVHQVIQAAAGVISAVPAQLLVIGDGQKCAELVRLADRLGHADDIHFPGFVTPEQGLAALYRLGDLFLISSEIETQGLVVLEAMASGLPIIAVNATCIPEIVHDGRNGYLVEPGDMQAMTEKTLFLLNRPECRAEMGVQSRKIVQRHSRRASLKQYEAHYQALIGQTEPKSTALSRRSS
jgi:glycosyltransferase involved in cell wall biosynthesis